MFLMNGTYFTRDFCKRDKGKRTSFLCVRSTCCNGGNLRRRIRNVCVCERGSECVYYNDKILVQFTFSTKFLELFLYIKNKK